MSWFQLDPASVAQRAAATPAPTEIPSLALSLRRGILGFTLVSIAGFAPWALGGRTLHRLVGEAGMYAACALVFIGLSGLLLHRLILGPGSLPRFYKLFGISFTAYSIAWIAGWMLLRGHPGSVVGLLAGTTLMGWMMTTAFDCRHLTLKTIAALFLLNSAGYFIGGIVEAWAMNLNTASLLNPPLQRRTQARIAMLLWGVFYGLGFGAGLALAFHTCQTKTRELLSSSHPTPPTA